MRIPHSIHMCNCTLIILPYHAYSVIMTIILDQHRWVLLLCYFVLYKNVELLSPVNLCHG